MYMLRQIKEYINNIKRMMVNAIQTFERGGEEEEREGCGGERGMRRREGCGGGVSRHVSRRAKKRNYNKILIHENLFITETLKRRL